MTNHDDEIDQLAIEVERSIAETQRFLDELPEFAPRSVRSKKMQRKVWEVQ